MLALQAESESLGVDFAFQTEFNSAEKRSDLFEISIIGVGGESGRLTCKMLINCAGNDAHFSARAIAGLRVAELPSRFLAKGSYCSLSGRSPFQHLIYPVPVTGALGIHATLDMAGSARFGPNIQWVDTIDYAMPDGLVESFSVAVRKY
jgi:L-2-hydroxyglutarate oxidase LhgO